MPVFQLTSPNGEKYKVTAPEGATAEQAFEFFKQSNPDLFASTEQTAPKFQPEKGNLEGMPRPRRTQRVPSAMAMKEVTEAAGGPAEFFGQTAAAAGRELARIPGYLYDLPVTLHNISPSTLLGITPEFEPQGVKTIDETLGLKQTPAQYAPAGFTASLVGQPIISAPFGAVARGAVGVANTLKKYVNPKLADYLAAADGKGAEIVNWLRGAEELVPGSQPTVAQALAAGPQGGAPYTRFAGLQPSGGAIPDEAINAYNVRDAAQREARVASLGTFAGTPLSVEMAQGQRLAKTSPMYEAARETTTPVDISPVLDRIDKFIAKNPGNPELLTEMDRLRKGLVIPETAVAPELARTNAEEIASSLDGLKTAIASEKNKFIKDQLTQIKDDIVAAIPGMKEAQSTYAAMSKPINEMNIGTVLKETLTGPYEGVAERATAFATKVKNAPQTAKLTTGQTARTLEEAGVSKANVDKVNKIMEDLNRDLLAEKLQRTAGSTMSKDPETKRLAFLNRLATVFNEVTGAIAAKVGQKKAIEIAFEMLDPKIAADVLEQAMAMEKTLAARSAAAARVGPTIQNVGTASALINNLAPPSQNSLATQTGQ